MRYFMVIDGAHNSTHDIFGIDTETFEFVFPEDRDIAFLDELEEKIHSHGLSEIDFFNKLYSNRVEKRSITGLHGILHITGSYCRKEYFPTRKEVEVINDRTQLAVKNKK